MGFGIPETATGFVLQRLSGDSLISTEHVVFPDGFLAVDTILRRAEICGWVGKFGCAVGDGNHFIDIFDANGDMLDVLPMSREAWSYLKRKTKARIFNPYDKIPRLITEVQINDR